MQHFLYENNLLNSIQCVIIGVLDPSKEAPPMMQSFDAFTSFYEQNKTGLKKAGDWIWYHNQQQHVIVFHCGEEKSYHLETLKNNIQKISLLFKEKPWKNLLLSMPQVTGLSKEAQLNLTILTLESCYYQFLNYKAQKEGLQLQTVYHDSSCSPEQIKESCAIAEGIRLCQDLANTPANECTPIDLEKAAKNLATKFKSLKCNSLDEHAMKKLGMNTLLSVAQGSHNPPRLIELHYQQGSQKKPIILVGKGITFDSGGICIKPSEGMYEMKYDMCGAATVLGVMQTIAMLNLPIHVIGILACAENMPGGHATRPGDIVKSHQGTTVEITNTDAEGRLVLADAMSYAKQYQPEVMIDIATLTGAVIIALGSVYSGLMTPDDTLADSLLNAGRHSLDKLWRLPMDKEYEECLVSPVADLMNSHNARTAGSIVAAHFLHAFSKDCRWAHLDIAGSAWVSGKNRQATGRPVALLVEWIKHFKYEN